MLPPSPVSLLDPSRVKLDKKFVDGMSHICAHWPGRVDCILRDTAQAIPFGAQYDIAELPFGLSVVEAGASVAPEMLAEYDLIEASGDMHLDLDLADRIGSCRARHVFVVEYTLRTRLEILRLDRTASAGRKVRSALWLLRQERRRRRALARADGVQTNGYPAFDRYRNLNDNSMMYLDNRMRESMFATSEEIASRIAALAAGGPLRLINSGRLEAMKGAQDLLPVASALRDLGINFTLDIYGTGSFEAEIASGIRSLNLGDRVRLHAPVDFELELVPIARRQADLFLSCHRQSDPSCTYIEAMGCGLPVAGYSNDMLEKLSRHAGGGWTVPIGNTAALARQLGQIAADPEALRLASETAVAFARRHDFATEFTRRNQHLLGLLDTEPVGADA